MLCPACILGKIYLKNSGISWGRVSYYNVAVILLQTDI